MAHVGPGPAGPPPLGPEGFDWTSWQADPGVVAGLVVLGAAYTAAILWRRRLAPEARVEPLKVVSFGGALLLLFGVLTGPIHDLSDYYLFSAHMIQHMLIAVVAPPLLLLGIPRWLAELPLRNMSVRTVARWLANPIVAFGVFQADIWLWHAPALYDLTLANDTVHILEHLTFLIFGLMYWLPILSPTPLIPRISRGFAILYLFIGCQPMVALGALLTFAAHPLSAVPDLEVQ